MIAVLEEILKYTLSAERQDKECQIQLQNRDEKSTPDFPLKSFSVAYRCATR